MHLFSFIDTFKRYAELQPSMQFLDKVCVIDLVLYQVVLLIECLCFLFNTYCSWYSCLWFGISL